MSHSSRFAGVLLLLASSSGCRWDEGLEIRDMRGRVILPRAAATRTITDAGGQTREITDVRLIGPVYLGLYPSIREGLRPYPHPEMGPAYQAGTVGDTYPYGGTSIGDFRFPCVDFLTCRLTSGRFFDFGEMVEWFNEVLELPIVDNEGRRIDNGDSIRQSCYEILRYTSDDEIRLTATRDRNGDGVIDHRDLDFVENADGDFEAEFTLWQQEYFDGFTLWGWMDRPSDDAFRFTTCNPELGQRQAEYTADFFGGRPYSNLLNFPDNYIGTGDWVAGMNGVHTYESPDDDVTIVLDFLVE